MVCTPMGLDLCDMELRVLKPRGPMKQDIYRHEQRAQARRYCQQDTIITSSSSSSGRSERSSLKAENIYISRPILPARSPDHPS